MKKTLLPFCVCIMMLACACKKEGFLQATDTSNLNKTTVFADSANAISFLGHIYNQTGFSFSPVQFGTAGFESACDEAEGYNSGPGTAYQQFVNGTVNSTNITETPYETCYKNIRAVNIFLKSIKSTPMFPGTKTYAIGEAHFLRAWFYAILMKYYGGVVIVGDTVYSSTTNVKDTRSGYSTCVNYILNECNLAMTYMPYTDIHANMYYGRANYGACLALESRVLLYAASPLFNQGNIAPGDTLTGYATDSLSGALIAQRWHRAAVVAKAIMTGFGSNTYTLYANENEGDTDSLGTLPGHGFKNLFVAGPSSGNTEAMFVQENAESTFFEQLWLPPSRLGTQHAWPYEETAEAFGMNNGKPITDPTSGYDPNNPYANRDPRFDYSILHNNELLYYAVTSSFSDYQPLHTYVDATTGDGFNNGTPTGYYIGKLVSDRSAGNAVLGSLTNHDYILLRFGEILLNYAEAENEYLPQPDSTVYNAVKWLRVRAGISAGTDGYYGLPQNMTQSQMRTVIQNERRVELAYESHRFFDVRRWKIADQTENMLLHGMEITLQPDGSFTYQVVPAVKHTFTTAMYFWPIPQSETSASAKMIQNPFYAR
jgi:hypothetical protein